jgi:RNA polymerase sigma factor (sigma-70 family)
LLFFDKKAPHLSRHPSIESPKTDDMLDIALKIGLRSDAPHSEETALIEGCLKEERWAQKKLYESFYPIMMGVCMRYANNREDARDLLNEGFVKVFKHLGRYQVGTSLEAWIRRIVINTCIDFYRKAIRQRTEDMELARNEAYAQEDPISKCSADDILKAVQDLPTSYRTVFNLYAIEGYSHKEIGDLLGITESTSRSNLVKARGKLQDMLAARKINRT